MVGEAMIALASFGLIISLIWWLLAAIIIADVARDKGRSAFGYFVMALVFSPFFAALVLIAAPDAAKAAAERAERERDAKNFKAGLESLWQQLEAIRQNTASSDLPVLNAKPQ